MSKPTIPSRSIKNRRRQLLRIIFKFLEIKKLTWFLTPNRFSQEIHEPRLSASSQIAARQIVRAFFGPDVLYLSAGVLFKQNVYISRSVALGHDHGTRHEYKHTMSITRESTGRYIRPERSLVKVGIEMCCEARGRRDGFCFPREWPRHEFPSPPPFRHPSWKFIFPTILCDSFSRLAQSSGKVFRSDDERLYNDAKGSRFFFERAR